jgi:hypothetical protein
LAKRNVDLVIDIHGKLSGLCDFLLNLSECMKTIFQWTWAEIQMKIKGLQWARMIENRSTFDIAVN